MAYPIIQNQKLNDSLASVAGVLTYQMPVNPVSAVLLEIEAGLSSGDAVDNLVVFLGKISSLNFNYFGTRIWSLLATDLYRVAKALGVWSNKQQISGQAFNSRRSMVLCLPFGRRLFDPTECFPAVKQGATSLDINFTADPALYSSYTINCHPIQLPGAAPGRFLRCNSATWTPAAVGGQLYDLPRTATCLGVGITQGHSIPQSAASSFDFLELLINDQQAWYNNIEARTMRAMAGRRMTQGTDGEIHVHNAAPGSAYVQNALSNGQLDSTDVAELFTWLELDPTGDGTYAVDATALSAFQLSVDITTAEALNVLPVMLYTPEQAGIEVRA